ncbi:MAG: leucyl/phenylalanyl-tRNA--protein transferase [Pseudomonadota bacterium]
MSELAWLETGAPADSFPPVERALREPDGLLAAGGDLAPDRLLYAYQHGIFPWFEQGQPVLWWSPNPRCVLPTDEFHRSRSLLRTVRRCGWSVTVNEDFAAVVDGCAEWRRHRRSTWITPTMRAAYLQLHERGFARSLEVWNRGQLIGGIYGVALGRMFFGESMFSREPDASKIAMLALCIAMRLQQMPLLDCQVRSPHLTSLGARMIARTEFLGRLRQLCPRIEPAPAFFDGSLAVLKMADSVPFPGREPKGTFG